MPESEPLTAQQKMLRNLEEIQRKVQTGAIDALVIVAHTTDRYVLTRVCGEPLPPHGVLILQELADEAKQIFLEEHNHPDDGRPRLRAAGVVEESGTAAEDSGGEGGNAS